jgi:mRNA interferase RelE/StbE
MYQIRILDAASRELGRLEADVRRRIVGRVHWLAENLDMIKPEALVGEFTGLYKLRVGNYRVIYEVLHSEKVIVIHLVGHRREIYRQK